MAILKSLGILWGFLRWLIAFTKKTNQAAEARFSEAKAAEDRLVLQALALDLIEGRGSTWAHKLLRLLGLSDDAGRYLTALLKSSKLDAITNGGSTLEKEKARAELAEVRAKLSGPHQP